MPWTYSLLPYSSETKLAEKKLTCCDGSSLSGEYSIVFVSIGVKFLHNTNTLAVLCSNVLCQYEVENGSRRRIYTPISQVLLSGQKDDLKIIQVKQNFPCIFSDYSEVKVWLQTPGKSKIDIELQCHIAFRKN